MELGDYDELKEALESEERALEDLRRDYIAEREAIQEEIQALKDALRAIESRERRKLVEWNAIMDGAR